MTIHATASKLDMDKFAKVHRLMSEGATDGERAAARARAEAMASRAGMTLKQATSKMDSKPKTRSSAPQPPNDWRDIFHGMDDWMEAKHPGYKAKQEQKKRDREERRAARRRDVHRPRAMATRRAQAERPASSALERPLCDSGVGAEWPSTSGALGGRPPAFAVAPRRSQLN